MTSKAGQAKTASYDNYRRAELDSVC